MAIFETNNEIYTLNNVKKVELIVEKACLSDPYDEDKGIIKLTYFNNDTAIIKFKTLKEAKEAKNTIASKLSQC